MHVLRCTYIIVDIFQSLKKIIGVKIILIHFCMELKITVVEVLSDLKCNLIDWYVFVVVKGLTYIRLMWYW